MKASTALAIVFGIACVSATTNVHAQDDSVARIVDLEQKLEKLTSQLEDQDDSAYGAFAFLIGIVCALWAQNTKRNAWLWFFFGLFLAPFAGIVMLDKNYRDIHGLPQSMSQPTLLWLGLLLAAALAGILIFVRFAP